MKQLSNSYVLSNGVKIPCMGLNTWKLPGVKSSANIIKRALDCGYRHIDTACAYRNENIIGSAIRESGFKRCELFITGKLDNPFHGYENTLKAFDMTMYRLGLDYLDLYLIHWPIPVTCHNCWKGINKGTWKAVEELYRDGKVKAIGVSNFMEQHIDALLEAAAIAPMVNQLELHPQYMQNNVVHYCKEKRIIMEAFNPLIDKRTDTPLTRELSLKYQKSFAQILLRWSLQLGFLPLVNALSTEQLQEYTDIFDFELSATDIEAISQLKTCHPVICQPDLISLR